MIKPNEYIKKSNVTFLTVIKLLDVLLAAIALIPLLFGRGPVASLM